MSHIKLLFGFILIMLLGIAAFAVYQTTPYKISTPSDLAENVGRRVRLSGKFSFYKTGDELDFQGTPLFVGWPHELSNDPDGITVIGMLRRSSEHLSPHEPEYVIDDAVQID